MKSDVALQRVLELSRRELLARGITAAGWGSFAVVLATGAVETLDFFFPRVLYKPPSTFKIGTPAQFLGRTGKADGYGIIFVDERWKPEHRFFIVRASDRIYAISARCVHLGCTINWFPGLGIFKCPCHGSEYRSDGTQFAGPAPRPLDRLRITLNIAGELVVDTSTVYGPERFESDGAFVRI